MSHTLFYTDGENIPLNKLTPIEGEYSKPGKPEQENFRGKLNSIERAAVIRQNILNGNGHLLRGVK